MNVRSPRSLASEAYFRWAFRGRKMFHLTGDVFFDQPFVILSAAKNLGVSGAFRGDSSLRSE
jgi:hypothetical protein